PSAMLWSPVVRLASAPAPTAVLSLVCVSEGGNGSAPSASTPTAVLLCPVVFPKSALAPMPVLPLPVVVRAAARQPTAVLDSPVVTLCSASWPRRVLPCSGGPCANACSETARQPNRQAMRNKPRGRRDRTAGFFAMGVIVAKFIVVLPFLSVG